MQTIIIQSIGTANPGTAKVLSDAFEINHELFTRMLYNTPSVFLENAEDEVTEKTVALLTQLGLEIIVQDSSEPLPEKSEPLDIAVHIINPLDLPKVARQLAEFIGCKESEALQLLLNEPSVVLGGVSLATANTLQKRLDAEVIASNPKTDLFTIEVTGTDELFINQFLLSLKNIDFHKTKEAIVIPDLTYTKAQEIWNKYYNAGKLKIYNQSYKRYQIQLNDFDLKNEEQTRFLKEQIGMPGEILKTIQQNLPVMIDESLNVNVMISKMDSYSKAGLNCEAIEIPFGNYKLIINNINNKKQVEELVSQFYKDAVIKENVERWTAPLPLNSVLNRYLEKQLELIGCEVEHQY